MELPRPHSCAWLCRINVPGSFSAVGAGALTRPPWQFPRLFVGAAHWAAREPSPLRERWHAKSDGCEGRSRTTCGARRAGYLQYVAGRSIFLPQIPAQE